MNPINSGMQATAAYRAAMQRLEQAAKPAPQAPLSGFAALLETEMSANLANLRRGETIATDAITGKASVQEVVEALGAAELSLQKVTTVRDRVISAYQEIIRMPI